MNINLTQKERMLLEDQKSHEQICIIKYSDYANRANDNQLKQICKANEQVERNHLDTINQLLCGKIPDMNQQSQNMQPGSASTKTVGSSLSDKDICLDLLSTEKYVSGTYNTVIFEFRDTRVRDLLNHVQKEEQKHGEAIFQYMDSKGMYNVQ